MQTLKQQPASDTRTTLAGRLKRLEEMYEMGHIERNEYLAKRQIVEGELDALPANVSAFNLQRAASRLDAMAGLWAKASDELRYQFVAEVFKRKRIEGKTLYLWPKPEYVPFLQPVLEQYDHQCGPEGIRPPMSHLRPGCFAVDLDRPLSETELKILRQVATGPIQSLRQLAIMCGVSHETVRRVLRQLDDRIK